VTPDHALAAAARGVCDLFGGDGWPRIEVVDEYRGEDDRVVLPLADDDADRVRALRKALRGTP
jgi:hypothetical protein